MRLQKPSRLRRCFLEPWLPKFPLSRFSGQKYAEDRPGLSRSHAALYPYRAAVFLNNIGADPKAQSGSGLAFRSEKSVKYARLHFTTDAHPGIGNNHSDTLAASSTKFPGLVSSHRESSAGTHGIQRVADQISNQLAQLSCKSQHRRHLFVLLFYFNPRVVQPGPEKDQH